jgi:hypothetical protein
LESFDYQSITEELIQANYILLDDKLSILRIAPLAKWIGRETEKTMQKSKNDATL